MLTVWCRLLQRCIGIIPSRAGGGVRGVRQASIKPSWPSVQTEAKPGTSTEQPSTHSDPDLCITPLCVSKENVISLLKTTKHRRWKTPTSDKFIPISPMWLSPVTTSEPSHIVTSAASDGAAGKLDGLSWADIIPAGKLTSRRWPDRDPQS